MNILIKSGKEHWNEYIQSCHLHDGGFLQSWQWGEFQGACTRKVWRYGEMKNENIIFGWQVIEMSLLPGLKYWYVPRPMMNYESGIMNKKDFFMSLLDDANRRKILFIRVDGGEKILENFGFKKMDMSVQPEEELIIDITQSEEELLKRMKPKTRYNIRVAEKHNIGIRNYKSGIMEKFNQFYRLVELTSARQGIRAHPKEYYKKMLECLGQDGMAELYTAQYQGKIIAAAIIAYFNGVATYLHGGTNDTSKFVMAPYLLHWQAILDAKAQGCARYNFGGVSLTKKSLEGITRFKTGFAPNTAFTKYAGVWDLPIRKKFYILYKITKSFRT